MKTIFYDQNKEKLVTKDFKDLRDHFNKNVEFKEIAYRISDVEINHEKLEQKVYLSLIPGQTAMCKKCYFASELKDYTKYCLHCGSKLL